MLKGLLTLAVLHFSLSANAGIFEEVFGPGKAAPLDVKSCPMNLTIKIDNIKTAPLEESDSDLEKAEKALTKVEPKTVSYTLIKRNKKEKLCHYESSSDNGIPGLLYMRGTKKYPQTAFATNLDLSGKLNIDVLVETYANNGLSVVDGQQIGVWSQDSHGYPVEIGSVRISND